MKVSASELNASFDGGKGSLAPQNGTRVVSPNGVTSSMPQRSAIAGAKWSVSPRCSISRSLYNSLRASRVIRLAANSHSERYSLNNKYQGEVAMIRTVTKRLNSRSVGLTVSLGLIAPYPRSVPARRPARSIVLAGE